MQLNFFKFTINHYYLIRIENTKIYLFETHFFLKHVTIWNGERIWLPSRDVFTILGLLQNSVIPSDLSHVACNNLLYFFFINEYHGPTEVVQTRDRSDQGPSLHWSPCGSPWTVFGLGHWSSACEFPSGQDSNPGGGTHRRELFTTKARSLI